MGRGKCHEEVELMLVVLESGNHSSSNHSSHRETYNVNMPEVRMAIEVVTELVGCDLAHVVQIPLCLLLSTQFLQCVEVIHAQVDREV